MSALKITHVAVAEHAQINHHLVAGVSLNHFDVMTNNFVVVWVALAGVRHDDRACFIFRGKEKMKGRMQNSTKEKRVFQFANCFLIESACVGEGITIESAHVGGNHHLIQQLERNRQALENL